MKISVLGLGYVGSVSAACFTEGGHTVMGVDPNPVKVDLINKGMAPVLEAELPTLISQAVSAGRLSATTSAEQAVLGTDISFVCVATPSQRNGSLDLRYIGRVCEEIGQALAKKDSFHVVVIRSTILPGTMRTLVVPTLEQHSGKKAGVDFGVCNNPEFLREGTAIYDFRHPPKTVIGETDPRSGDLVQQLYTGIPGPMIRCPIEVGEMVKYADNCWHAVKVAFANEIGNICKSVDVDGHQVMEIFCQDTKLNLSPYYMKPGYAFGGSCLPKDLRALTYKARSEDIPVPLLESVMLSNRAQIERGVSMVRAEGKRKIGILGFSFKAGTDDLRESPLVELIERLIGSGYELRLYDQNVNMARLVGANRDYILNVIPHIERLMVESIDEVLDNSDVLVIGNNAPEFADISSRLKPEQKVIDFIRIPSIEKNHPGYEGICW